MTGSGFDKQSGRVVAGELKAPGAQSTFLVAVAAFAFVNLAGLLLAFTAPMLLALRTGLADAGKALLHLPSLVNLGAALLDLFGYTALTLLQPFVMILVFLLVEIRLAGPPKSWGTTARSLFYRAVETVLNTVIALLLAKLFARLLPGSLMTFTAAESPNVLVATASATLMILVALLLQDFGVYWAHRLQHRAKALWRFHSVHHSIEHLDAANNYLHPLDHALPLVFVGLIGAIIGLSYEDFLIVSAIRVMHDHFIHSRAPIHLGRFRAFFVDNRYHHFHHSRHFEHYNKNFSAYFTLWDRVFGTCYIPADDEMVETGIVGTRPAPTLWKYLTADLEGTGEDLVPPPPRGQP
ncbi:sterol desaturase family protein [Acidimangrovimonas sediminis]|uniref:sterol desaturase family protein n=1 Tax=Acidimangrovimonas sediminis TaxID=2056283 RepID=UPI0011AF6E2D|nr:sterol desaturase family protein [Acidimangrovimonas sediminis]